jgi:hypothetical protein
MQAPTTLHLISSLQKRGEAQMAKRLGIDTFAISTDIDTLLNLRTSNRRTTRAEIDANRL